MAWKSKSQRMLLCEGMSQSMLDPTTIKRNYGQSDQRLDRWSEFGRWMLYDFIWYQLISSHSTQSEVKKASMQVFVKIFA